MNNCLTEFTSNSPGSPGLWDEEDDCCTRWPLRLFEKEKEKGDLAKKKKGRKKKKVTQHKNDGERVTKLHLRC